MTYSKWTGNVILFLTKFIWQNNIDTVIKLTVPGTQCHLRQMIYITYVKNNITFPVNFK